MKRLFPRLAAGILLLGLLAPQAGAVVYLDVNSWDWYVPAVSFVVRKGLLTGVGPGQFAPQQSMTRGMFYTVLSRIAGAETDNQTATNLQDVPPGKWYTGPVVWAVSNGLADCRSADAFGAEENISRVELCLALYRYQKLAALQVLSEGHTAAFPDLGGLTDEELEAVAACQAAGVIQGRGDGRFDPYAGATRAEVSQILGNFCQLPGMPELPAIHETAQFWDNQTMWTGEVGADFPLSSGKEVTAELVQWLNKRILNENTPIKVAAQGTTLDGDPKHLTNYGPGGYQDCINVSTVLKNKNNEVEAGVALHGAQEYYGYSLQVDGTLRQDKWHQLAQDSGKSAWQCTWWVWGRAAQYLELRHGLDLKALCNGKDNLGHGGSYYRNLKPYFKSDMTPSANSIISWSCGSYGHVAYVEAVDDEGIWVSMADSGHSWRGVTYIKKTDSEKNPYPLYWYPYETLNGFNHLDQRADGTAFGE